MSFKVRMENGSLEKFHRSYIMESLETIGMDHDEAKTISKMIEPHKDMTQHEIKVKVFKILDEMDHAMADKYLVTKKVHVKHGSFQVDGEALIPDSIMEYLDLQTGNKIDLIHCTSNCTLRAHQKDHSEDDGDVVFLSKHDMRKIEAKGKTLVAICKHVEH
jgi:hypothetical protein